MIEITEFFRKLKQSIETHSKELKEGELFLPKYLRGKVLIERVFPEVVKTCAHSLNLEFTQKYRNKLPSEYECGNYHVIDYVLKEKGKPFLFFDVKSLDGSQFSLFWEHEGVSDQDNNNKLRY